MTSVLWYHRGSMKLLTALTMVAFWPGLAAASPETDFWRWFQEKESKLYAFESDRDAVFNSLSAAMQRVNPDLTFGYLFLDQALGEYAVETQVGFIEFAGHDSRYFDESSPLSELPKRFDNYWKSESR